MRTRIRPAPVFLLLLLLFVSALTGLRGAPREFTGTIDGALYQVIAPEGEWNGSLWIEAHGLRMPDTPLVASLSVSQLFNAELLKRGWALATTSYRRNGVIVDDAIEDVLNLRLEAVRLLGAPKLVVVEGSSMGGGIATLLAESRHAGNGFDGVVAIGAALHVVDAQHSSMRLRHAPRIPILYLTNQSELDGPAAYVEEAQKSPGHRSVPPVLWKVRRDGHVNVNAAERLAALDAIVAWIDTRVAPGARDDATMEPSVETADAAITADGSMLGKVTDLARVYGNLFTDLKPSDLARIGVKGGDFFLLNAPGGEYRVRFATTYADVAEGEWVAFVTAEGTMMIARNRANAATTAGLDTGDSFSIAAVR